MGERPILFSAPMVRALLAGRKTMTRRLVTNRAAARIEVGDVLWVKETWAYFGGDEYIYQRDPGAVQYRASADAFESPAGGRWRPSIFMPRWASRISLLVTGKRTERAHDISEADARAEGIERCGGFMGAVCWTNYGADGPSFDHSRDSFRSLWCSINGPESWSANPEVFAFTFERVEAPAREGGR